MNLRIGALVGILCGLSLGASAAHAWERFMPYPWSTLYVIGLQFDRRGSVILTALGDEVTHSGSRAVSFGRADGTLRWTFDLPDDSGGENQVRGVALDRRGDLVLAARGRGREDEYFEGFFTVIKLDGATGAVRWHPDFGIGSAGAVAVDDACDVVVSGFAEGLRPFQLVKLSGDDGRVLWGSETPAHTLFTDARGDVVARSDAVVKLDGATGDEVWRTSSQYSVVGLVRGGHVAATTCEGDEAHVVVLDGHDGAELWRRSFPTGRHCSLRAAVFRDRDVVIAAIIGPTVHLARLDGRSGVPRWERSTPSEEPFASVSRLATGRSDIIVYSHEALLRLSPANGEESFRSLVSGMARGDVAVSPRGRAVLASHRKANGTDGLAVETLSRRRLRGAATAR